MALVVNLAEPAALGQRNVVYILCCRSITFKDCALRPAALVLHDVGPSTELGPEETLPSRYGLHVRQVTHRLSIFVGQFAPQAHLFAWPAEVEGLHVEREDDVRAHARDDALHVGVQAAHYRRDAYD